MNQKVYVIGANAHGECGVDGAHNLSMLTDFNSANPNLTSSIKHIFNGNGYTIYYDNNNNLYTSGDNKHYSCCVNEKIEHLTTLKRIDYFEEKAEIDNNKKKEKKKSKKRKKKKRKAERQSETAKPIKIKKICVSVSGYCSFFVSEQNIVYGNGNNRKYQLGFDSKESEWWENGFKFKCEPKEIKSIVKNLIDIKTASNYSLALRMSDKGIMFLYCNRSKYATGLQLHDDVLQLIIAYVGKLTDMDCAVYVVGNGRSKWRPVKQFRRKDMVKIGCGVGHSLALESNGMLWSWGNNRYLQCGAVWSWRGDPALKCIKAPTEIAYFKENNIEIKDIKCGWNHNLVIDSKKRVYAFGRNTDGQCGYGSDGLDDVSVSPVRLIEAFKGYEIKEIECGANHSYVQTVDGKHFLFGKNVRNQCITNDERQAVVKPFCINAIIEEKTKGKIKKVTLGVDNTQIIVSI